MTTTRTATRPPVAPAEPTLVMRQTRILPCETCKADMPHSLTKSGGHYVCSCGTQIEYHINDSPAMWAIR